MDQKIEPEQPVPLVANDSHREAALNRANHSSLEVASQDTPLERLCARRGVLRLTDYSTCRQA
jgi:hypothetical protein